MYIIHDVFKYNGEISNHGRQVETFLMHSTFSSKGGFGIIINGITIYKVFKDHHDLDAFFPQKHGPLESEWDTTNWATKLLRKFQIFANKVNHPWCCWELYIDIMFENHFVNGHGGQGRHGLSEKVAEWKSGPREKVGRVKKWAEWKSQLFQLLVMLFCFSQDPGVSGVRSMGPGVCHSLQDPWF